MNLAHLILNLAGLLLWLGWRAKSPAARFRPTGGGLLSTLRPAGAANAARWWFLGGLVTLLLARSFVYWYLGRNTSWSPSVPLGPVTISFRCDRFDRVFWFSLASLGLLLVKFYSWLLFLSVMNNRLEGDPTHLLVRRHLGWLNHWPAVVRFLLPGLFMGLVWLGVGPLLARLGWHPVRPFAITLQQSLLVGLAAFLAWEYLLVIILGIHLVSTYVYLGSAPLWHYCGDTARKLLRWVDWMPLRFGLADFGPVVGIVLVLLVCEISARYLPYLYRRVPLW